MKPKFLEVAREMDDPVTLVTKAYKQMAKSATVLMGYNATKNDYQNVGRIVQAGREAFNLLCFIAASSLASRAPSRAGSTMPLEPADMAAMGTSAAMGSSGTGLASLHYMSDAQRPNMYIAVHYPDFAAEYSIMVNCNTLTGEDLHR